MRKSPLHRWAAVLATLMSTWEVGTAVAGDAGVVRIADHSRPSVVRITDQVVRGQSPVDMTQQVQQTSLCRFCDPAPVCPDYCETSVPMYTDCPSYHDCPECSPCGCGHECPVVGWLLHALEVAHSIKADLWQACGLPSHCCLCNRTPRIKRLRSRSYDRVARAGRAAGRRERLGVWLSHSRFNYFIPRGCGGKGCPPCGHYTIVYPVDPWYGDCRDGGVYAAEGYGGPMSVPLAPVIRHTFNYGWGVPSSRLTPVSHLASLPHYGYGYAPPGWNGAYAPYAAQSPTPIPLPESEESATH